MAAGKKRRLEVTPYPPKDDEVVKWQYAREWREDHVLHLCWEIRLAVVPAEAQLLERAPGQPYILARMYEELCALPFHTYEIHVADSVFARNVRPNLLARLEGLIQNFNRDKAKVLTGSLPLP